MRKRMLRSALAAAFSAVVAFGTLSGLAETRSDVPTDSAWSTRAATAAPPGDSTWVVVAASDAPADSTWGMDDSTWAAES
ncbi:hypothetical protein [Streptomyces sp. AC555_RSS877]|uniref:hypothetical protein n=1 Tax=Streptomyces sp. AC555_RSS877 TaxID=2823688 RepID=UPI0020B773F6|nr:hypothetical protein [Streptomyces sp. AC555_RSS877]